MRKLLSRKVLSVLLVIAALPLMASYAGIANPLPNGVFLQGVLSSGTVQSMLGIPAGGSDVNLNWAASNNLNFTRGGSTQWRLDASSNFLGNGSNNTVAALTNDGNDANTTCLGGGGACTDSRGGYVKAYGNENASTGVLELSSGNVASTGVINLKTLATNRWIVNAVGDFAGDSLSGNISISRVGKGVSQSSTTGLTAAGSTLSDCLALSRVYNHFSTVAAGTGACLWSPDLSGMQVFVQNFGANDLKLYPATAGGSINSAGAGNPITLAAATDDMAICYHRGSNNWGCLVGPGKST